MSDNCEDELQEGNLVEDDVFSEICVKYSNFKYKLNNINEDKHKLSKVIYKDYVPKTVTKDTNFVLSQINQNVDMLESSEYCTPVQKICRTRSAKDVDKTFLAFADLKHDSKDVDDTSDEQWDNNTQIAQIADNIDALTYLVNCKENQENTSNLVNENKIEEKIFENIFLDDLKNFASNSDNFQNEIFPTSPVIRLSQNVNIEENAMKRKRTDIQNLPNYEKCDVDKVNFSGFLNGRNKKIKISDVALSKVKNIFTDIHSKLSEEIDFISSDVKEIKQANQHYIENATVRPFEFRTTDDKSVTISNDALNKVKTGLADFDLNVANNRDLTKIDVKNEIEDINFNSEDSKVIDDIEKFFFMTANNKKILVSEDSLNKAKAIFKDIDLENDDRNQFKTLNTNSILYEENKTRRNIPSIIGNNEEKFSFMTANNKKISVSDAALNKAKFIFKEFDLENNDQNKRGNPTNIEYSDEKFSFMTANNKKISVSDAALNKAKSIFEDIDSKSSNQNLHKKLKSNLISCEENKTERSSPSNIRSTEEKFSFTTANNKKISVPEAALHKAKAIFKDIDLNTENEDGSQILGNMNTNPTISTDLNHVNSFSFVTGNNKKISVSENSLNKARVIFNDLNLKTNKEESFRNMSIKSDHVHETDSKNEIGFAFMTANNKKIKISDEELKKAKDIFLEMESIETNKLNLNSKSLKLDSLGISTPNENIENSDQTLKKTENNHWDENLNKSIKYNVPSLKTLSTKFIMNDKIWFPKQNTKSVKISENIAMHQSNNSNEEIESFSSPSSPIIQSKMPIKRKKIFKVPYRKEGEFSQDSSIDKKLKLDKCPQRQLMDNCNFSSPISLGTLKNDKYHRNKNVIKLKNLNVNFCNDKDLSLTEFDILMLTPQNFDQFVFKENRICSDVQNIIKIDDIIKMFTEHTDVNEKLIPKGWVYNHIKWITWKLASYERMYANNELVLTVPNVLMQLKYRYDRELCEAERPILRKILEKDDIPSKRMVLCVSNIIEVQEKTDGKIERVQKSKYEVELTDGWYDVTTTIDPLLSLMIDRKKIIVGTKLIISGAELLNCPQGISPLEEKGNVRLKIWANNCRRCASWMKLGLQKNCDKPITFKLKTCKPGSGPIPILRIVPVNIYPILFLNKLSDGTVVMNSDKIQHLQNSKMEDELQKKFEQIYEKVQKEYCDEENSSKKNTTKAIKRKSIDSAEELIDAYETSADPAEFLNGLSMDKRNTLEQYVVEKNMKVRQKIDDRVRSLMQELSIAKEQPVKVLKARIVSLDDDDFTSAILTIWKPDEAMLDFFKEGITIDVTNLTPTGIRSNELHLSAGKRSTFTEVPSKKFTENYSSVYKLTNKCTEFEELYLTDFVSRFNEINLVGIVVDLIPSVINDNEKDAKMQTLYLTNERSQLMAVNFWGGVKKYGFNKIIEKGAYLACSNLQYRTKSIVKRIRQLYVTELTNFTQYPKKEYLLTALQNLKRNMTNIQIEDFIKNCSEELLNSLNLKNLHIERTNYLKNCFIDKLDDISSIDFNSSLTEKQSNEKFKESSDRIDKSNSMNISSIISDSTINANQSTSLVEMRINKLKLYGEPPPFAPIVLKNSPRVNKKFISPSQHEIILDRPINENQKIIEESDYSPPLSLE